MQGPRRAVAIAAMARRRLGPAKSDCAGAGELYRGELEADGQTLEPGDDTSAGSPVPGRR